MSKVIDVEFHYTLESVAGEGTLESGQLTERYWGDDGKVGLRHSSESAEIERYVDFMDAAGVDVGILTHHNVGLDDPAEWHDYCVELHEEYPDRLVGFATVNPVGGQDSLDELERAVADLGLKGVHIYTRNDGNELHLDDDRMWPFYETVSDLDVPINVHIEARPAGFEALEAPYALYYVAAREFDIAAETLRLIFGGVLEEFPDLDFIMNHFGGGIAGVLDRFDLYTGYAEDDATEWTFYKDGSDIETPYREHFEKLYFNVAGRGRAPATVQSALTQMDPSQLMFGTDWPLNYDGDPEGARGYIEDIQSLDLPQEDIDAILGGNAAEVIGLD